MTRKQALAAAIEALNAAGQNPEAVQVLHTMQRELPLNRWTEAAIRDAVEQFILDHGRPPMCADFKKGCLPPHTVIQLRFGLTLQAWLDQNYPTVKPSPEALHAQATEDFIREYLRLRPLSAEDYNARRVPPARSWYTIAVYNHTRRWRVLLEKLELPVYSKRDVPEATPRLQVKVISDTDFGEN